MSRKHLILLAGTVALFLGATGAIWFASASSMDRKAAAVLAFVWEGAPPSSVALRESIFVEPGFIGQNEGLAAYLSFVIDFAELLRLTEKYGSQPIRLDPEESFGIAQLKYSGPFEARFGLAADELDYAFPLFRIGPGNEKLFPAADHPEKFRLCYVAVDSETSPSLKAFLYCPGGGFGDRQGTEEGRGGARTETIP